MAEDRQQQAEELLKSVNEAASAVSTRFVTFVTVGAYVGVTVASTTHEMLLRATNLVTLPLLNAQIPIVGAFGFYTIAPWLIVLLHSDLLLQLSILANELGRFETEMRDVPEPRRGNLRQRLANFYYVLYFTGQSPSRFLHILSALITWITVVALPLALLLWIQVRFLPFHSRTDTWLHRTAVLTDVALILCVLLPWITPLLGSRRKQEVWYAPLRQFVSVRALVVLACVATAGASLFVARIPSGPHEAWSWFTQNMILRERVLTANALRPEDVNALRDDDDLSQLRDVLERITPFQSLQGRDFRYADLYNAVLPKLDLRAVHVDSERTVEVPADCDARRDCEDPGVCEDPGLQRTALTGATLQWASMQQAMFDDAILDGADLAWAKIQSSSFYGAHLNGAILRSAKVQEARLSRAKLCGANLAGAALDRAVLDHAFLRGASLRGARLVKANFERADLRGADLSDADLTDANLRGAQLQGAILRGAVMNGTLLDGATLEMTDVSVPSEARGGDGAKLYAYLTDLACGSEWVARGVASQALTSAARDRQRLTRALLDARLRTDCGGVSALPPGTVLALARSLSTKAGAK